MVLVVDEVELPPLDEVELPPLQKDQRLLSSLLAAKLAEAVP